MFSQIFDNWFYGMPTTTKYELESEMLRFQMLHDQWWQIYSGPNSVSRVKQLAMLEGFIDQVDQRIDELAEQHKAS